MPGQQSRSEGRISVPLQRYAGICTSADERRRSKSGTSGEIRRSSGNEEQRHDHEGSHGRAERQGRRQSDQSGCRRAL